MIPDYQTLMRPVLEVASSGEIHIQEIISSLASQFHLTEEEQSELLPSGKQPKFANRVHWARTYLKQAGLVEATRRGYITITDRGREALKDDKTVIDNAYLKQFEDFQKFQSRTQNNKSQKEVAKEEEHSAVTPDEILRASYQKLNETLAVELLDNVRNASPVFFEHLIVELLLAMGYGGSYENAGQALRVGGTGDDGIDGVIDQDPLGVDQVYIQAKRYSSGNNIGANHIRDFFGALNIKKAQKGIFFTTSDFTSSATQTAKDLGIRIVLINGEQLGKLMIRYNIGCRDEEVMHIKRLDEDFFEWES